MPDIRKEQERDELHRAIWAIADELRGSVDGWDFKSYVLGMMFHRYISENLTNYINEGEIEAGNDAFGDAYEFLMSMYASNAGKSGGEFFTPQEVSELLTRIAVAGKTEVNKVYDYNLSVSTYVEAEDIREVIHIVKLNAEIREIEVG